MTTPFNNSILELDGSHLQNVNIASGVIGPPPSGDGVWGRDNALNINNTDSLGLALDKIITFLEDSTVNNSELNIDRADEITLSMLTNSTGNIMYSATSAMTGQILNVINPFNNPQTNPFNIFYDNGGKIVAVIRYANNTITEYNNNLVNTQINSTKTIPPIPLDNIGVKNFITINNDSLVNGAYSLNMYIGGLSALVPSFNAGPSVFGFKLKHINTSNKTFESNEILFSVDNPLVPSAMVSGIYGITGINATGYISGIPVLQENDTITITFRADNCIRAFYNSNYIAKLYNNIKNDIFISPAPFVPVIPGIIPSNGVPSSGGITNTNPTFTVNVNLNNNLYFDKTTLFNTTLDVRNSAGTTTTVLINNIVIGVSTPFNRIMCDSISTRPKTTTFINENYVIFPTPEINRVPSGTGLFPSLVAFPGPILPSEFSDRAFNSLTDANITKELILFNGKYQYLSYNFSDMSPVGPDYTTLLPDTSVITMPNLRWVTFCKRFSNINFTRINFTINTDGINWVSADSQANSPIINNVQILATIREGLSDMPWFDCNKAGINPQNEGDGCLDATSSTLFNKYITCGKPNTPRNGKVFIRIGLPIGMSLTGITIN